MEKIVEDMIFDGKGTQGSTAEIKHSHNEINIDETIILWDWLLSESWQLDDLHDLLH